MKMKEVCQRTGLTEKAVRLYIKQELVEPQVEEGVHTNAYTFREEDVARLQDVAALREAGFSLADIRQMQQNPDQIPALLAEKETLLAAELRQKQAVQAALQRMETGSRGELGQVADALRPARRAAAETPPTGAGKKAVTLLVLTVLVLLLGWYYFQAGGVNRQFVPLFFGLLALLAGGISLLMAFRYATAPRRAARLPARGTAVVLEVVKDTGIDGSAVRGGAGMTGVREPGVGGDWQFVWFLWNEIRPDHWFPLLRYEADGEKRSATFPYGGLRGSWQEGEALEVAWDPARRGEVYPLRAPWLRRKALAYLALGAALLAAGAALLAVFASVIAAM